MVLLDRDGLAGENVSLGVGVEVSKAQSRLNGSLILLPVDVDVELSATSLVPGLPASCHASYHDNRLP